MKQNIWTIKNILRIIISVLVIATMIKSCSMAASWQTITTTLTDEQIVDRLVEKFDLNLNGHKNDILWGIARGFSFDIWPDNAQFVVGQFTNNKDNLNGVTFNGCYWVRNCLTSSAASNYYNREVYFSTGGNNTIYTLRRYNSSWHEYSTIGWSINDPVTPPETYYFVFNDNTHTATMPTGETAYCVFIDPLQNYQKIGYINDYINHKPTEITIFSQNYRNLNDVQVGNIGENNYYLNESGELFVNTNTMWTPLVYEIVGMYHGISGDFTDDKNFLAYYYIAARNKYKWRPIILWL